MLFTGDSAIVQCTILPSPFMYPGLHLSCCTKPDKLSPSITCYVVGFSELDWGKSGRCLHIFINYDGSITLFFESLTTYLRDCLLSISTHDLGMVWVLTSDTTSCSTMLIGDVWAPSRSSTLASGSKSFPPSHRSPIKVYGHSR